MLDPIDTDPSIPTPCTGVCAIGDDGLCGGCLRTIDEIARWATLGRDERLRLMEGLSARASER